MNEKTIQCLPNPSQHVHIYLQQFPSYSNRKCKKSPFSRFHHPHHRRVLAPRCCRHLVNQTVRNMIRTSVAPRVSPRRQHKFHCCDVFHGEEHQGHPCSVWPSSAATAELLVVLDMTKINETLQKRRREIELLSRTRCCLWPTVSVCLFVCYRRETTRIDRHWLKDLAY